MPCSHLMSCETGNGGGGVGSGVELPHGTNHPQFGLLASSKSQSTPRNFLSPAPLSGLVGPSNSSCFPALTWSRLPLTPSEQVIQIGICGCFALSIVAHKPLQ